MSYQPNNPFEHEDWFCELVRIDNNVKTSLKSSYNNFQTQYNPQSMTKFQKILTFFTTHTLTAVVTATICLGAVGTFAAQTVAPEAYKPSTVINNLFKNNKVQQNNSNTPLVADPNNDVVSYDPCNISIKYPKQIAGEKIIAVQPQDYNQPGDKAIPSYYGVSIMSKKNFDYDYSTKIENLVSIGCSPTIIPPTDNNLNSKMTISELSELTGWFITSESKIEDIFTESQATAGPYRKIYFKFNNLYYDVSFVTNKVPTNLINSQTTEVQGFWNKTINSPGIFGDQIQIQFNNITKNIANTQVITTKQTSSSSNTSSTSSLVSSQSKTITKENITLNFTVAGPKPDTGFTMQSQNADTYYFPYSLGYDYNIAGDSFIFDGEVEIESQNSVNGPYAYKVKSVKKLNNSNDPKIPAGGADVRIDSKTLLTKENIVDLFPNNLA